MSVSSAYLPWFTGCFVSSYLLNRCMLCIETEFCLSDHSSWLH